jgi:hypothetical protein
MTLVIFKDKEIPLYSSWYGLNGWSTGPRNFIRQDYIDEKIA